MKEYSAKDLAAKTGLSRRQIHTWAISGLLRPSLRRGRQGIAALYSEMDLLRARRIAYLLRLGVPTRSMSAALMGRVETEWICGCSRRAKTIGIGDQPPSWLVWNGAVICPICQQEEEDAKSFHQTGVGPGAATSGSDVDRLQRLGRPDESE